MFVSSIGPRYTCEMAAQAVADSLCMAETLRRLGMCPTGNNRVTLKKWLALWEISTDHFDPDAARRPPTRARIPLEEVLVEHSTFSRGHLKERLYDEGLKARSCELCAQGEEWRGRRMSLILDHVNGVGDDNRLENLRIVCPNCAATLDTHCGRGLRRERPTIECPICHDEFQERFKGQRYCSRACGQQDSSRARRTVGRPDYNDLLEELTATNFSVVAHRYGVSDNAIRKWLRQYEREWALERAAAKRVTA